MKDFVAIDKRVTKRNTKFRIAFRYPNMYESTQNFLHTFLYMSTTCCESFKSFGEIRKKFFY